MAEKKRRPFPSSGTPRPPVPRSSGTLPGPSKPHNHPRKDNYYSATTALPSSPKSRSRRPRPSGPPSLLVVIENNSGVRLKCDRLVLLPEPTSIVP